MANPGEEMKTSDAANRIWIRRATLLIPVAAVALIAPLSGCSKKDADVGALVDRDRPLYRSTQSGLAKELAEIERKTAETYKDTGSRAFAKEVERRYKEGRRDSEVGISRPGMSREDQKQWDALGN